jgi:hypothetical protein
VSAQRLSDYRTGRVTLVQFPQQEPAWDGGAGDVEVRYLTPDELAAIRASDALFAPPPMLPIRGIMSRAEIDARRRLETE